MTYSIFSDHAPTGETAQQVVSSNPYSIRGRSIGYPTNFDLFTRYLSDSDGSKSVIENRKVDQLVGSRLYLYHRPLVMLDGTATTISVSAGTLDTSFTNASQAYIVFSDLPTVDFTVSYTATPDCDTTWGLNNLQDSVMELQGILGPNNDTTYPGIKNLKIATFNNPTGFTANGVLNNGVHLSHLDQDITIASTDDATLAVTRGNEHTIQIGRAGDNVIFDSTGFNIIQSNGTYTNTMNLGGRTGDHIYWMGAASGAGHLTLGGPEWTDIYSGKIFTADLTGSYYTGSMLRVHGNASFMGNIKAIGNITIVNTTGSTSVVLGDWTVRDELFVEGVSHLIGPTETNLLTVQKSIHLAEDLIADNFNGAGGNGQSLIDGLDCSEIAWTYGTVTKARHPNSVISAPIDTANLLPKNVVYRPWMVIGPENLAGDLFAITGQLNASASSSGTHPHILQLLTDLPIASGKYLGTYGSTTGIYSDGLVNPGSLWIRMLNGPAENFESPIYGHTVEETGTIDTVTRLNVFIPEAIATPPLTNNYYMLYNPYSVVHNTVSAAGGGEATYKIHATTQEPLAVSFEDSVRVLKTDTSWFSLDTALTNSVSGLAGSPTTGIAYIFADSNNTDVENSPIFKARANPIRMKGQAPIGEVVASYNGSTWTILDTISYRPNGLYDSAWIPIHTNTTGEITSGRFTPGISCASADSMKLYFNHHLGTDVDIGNISANLYLGSPETGSITWNQNHTHMYNFFGQDHRNNHGVSGALIHIPLGAHQTTVAATDRDASIFYLDSTLIGVDMSPGVFTGIMIPEYLRLIVNKNN